MEDNRYDLSQDDRKKILAMRYKLIYSLCGLFWGWSCIFGGMLLFVRGISGSSNWVTKFIGIESNIANAAPGTILFLIGLFIVIVTRYNVRVKIE